MKTIKYFFSYSYTFSGGHGFGSCCLYLENDFDYENDAESVCNLIAEESKHTEVAILNFIKLH